MKDPIFQLCDTIRETAYALHCHLKHGHREKIYENGLVHRLNKLGIKSETQKPYPVKDEDGTVLGENFTDLIVAHDSLELLIETKAVKNLLPEHYAQIIGYLRASSIEHGLLINFGAPQLQIKKFTLSKLDS